MISESIKAAIRKEYEANLQEFGILSKLARKYKVSLSTVRKIVNAGRQDAAR